MFFSLQKREAPSLVDTAVLLQCVHQPAQHTAVPHPHPHPNRYTTPPTSTTTTSTTCRLRLLPCQLPLSQLLLQPPSTASNTCGNTSHLLHHAPAPCLLLHQSSCQLLPHPAHQHASLPPQSALQLAHQCAARSDQDKSPDVYIQEHCDSCEDVVVYGVVLWSIFVISAVNPAVSPEKRQGEGCKTVTLSYQ